MCGQLDAKRIPVGGRGQHFRSGMDCFGYGSAPKNKKTRPSKKRQTIEVEVSPAHQNKSKLITGRTNRKLQDENLHFSPSVCHCQRDARRILCGRGFRNDLFRNRLQIRPIKQGQVKTGPKRKSSFNVFLSFSKEIHTDTVCIYWRYGTVCIYGAKGRFWPLLNGTKWSLSN